MLKPSALVKRADNKGNRRRTQSGVCPSTQRFVEPACTKPKPKTAAFCTWGSIFNSNKVCGRRKGKCVVKIFVVTESFVPALLTDKPAFDILPEDPEGFDQNRKCLYSTSSNKTKILFQTARPNKNPAASGANDCAAGKPGAWTPFADAKLLLLLLFVGARRRLLLIIQICVAHIIVDVVERNGADDGRRRRWSDSRRSYPCGN
uniref:Uncharacterized protein n=1 Tax=Romanomermis culicivorax TaxID=13658 RepID=A0A915IBB9_ROMCU